MGEKKAKSARPKAVRDWQKKRTQEWRRKWYAQGYTYKKINGHWGWVKKKSRIGQRARVHSNDPQEIERLRKKLRGALKK